MKFTPFSVGLGVAMGLAVGLGATLGLWWLAAIGAAVWLSLLGYVLLTP